MDNADRRNSLKLRYGGSTTNIPNPNTGSQEYLVAKFKTTPEETTTAAVSVQQENRKTFKSNDSVQQSTENDVEHQKLATEVAELTEKLQQATTKDSEYQKQIQLLQEDLKAKEETIKSQAHKISDLNNSLLGETQTLDLTRAELLSVQKLLEEKDEKEEMRLQEMSTQGIKLEEMSVTLEQQRVENAELEEKIRNLLKPSGEVSKIERELEKCLSEETAKTNTIREELEYVIQNINEEKEEFHKYFEEFRASANAFLVSCGTHRDAVLNAIKE